MARPRKKEADKQTHRLFARATAAEYACAAAKAAQAGVTLSEHVRRMSVDGQVNVRRDSAYAVSLAHQLKRIGVLLNQLTRVANGSGELPEGLARVCEQLETILDRIIRME